MILFLGKYLRINFYNPKNLRIFAKGNLDMKGKELDNLLVKLELKDSGAVFFKNRENEFDVPLHFETRKRLELINPDAIYVFNKQPSILFFDLTNENSEERENDIHKKVWSFDNSPVIFIIKDKDITAYNALNYIKNENQNRLEKITFKSEKERNEKFSFWSLQSGTTWEWLQKDYSSGSRKKETQKRVNERLFQNIKDVRKELMDSGIQENDANSLILKLIFIRYLIDREVDINKAYISGKTINDKRKCFCELITQPKKLKELFEYLNGRFNGVLFKDSSVSLNKDQSKFLANVFGGELLGNDSLFAGYFFEIFDFSIIPVELISGIYESLIDKETQELNSAVYTPPFLVDYILTDTVDKHLEESKTSDCKIFEVAVGSGIFLVQSLRRMIEKEIMLNGNKGKKKFGEKIRKIATDNLFGVDVNEDALRVTCFSIYVALLDYIEPKEIGDKYIFPNLIGNNLFKANFFDTKHPFNEKIKEVKPDFILGNPPWKSKKDDEIHIRWLKENNKTVGRYEIAQSFLLRTKDFMQSNTKTALVVTSTMFYNVSNTSKKFKNEFLTTYCIERFFDLSPVRHLVFKEKNSPASIVYFRLPKNKNDILKNIVNHQSVKINYFLKYFKMLVIEKYDQKKIQQKYFIENDWLFKVALYGNVLDFVLLKKLYTLDATKVSELIDNVVLFKGAGIERGKETKTYNELVGLPILENKSIKQDYLGTTDLKVLTTKDVHLSRGRDKNIFIGNKILFKEQAFNESDPLISYVDKDLVFRKGLFSISSKDENIIKFLYAFFKSNLTTYFLFLVSAAWGVGTRPAIRFDDELLNLPIIEPDKQTKAHLIGLVNKFLKPFEKHYSKFNLGDPFKDEKILAQINSIIDSLYGINDCEKDLIDYVLGVSRFQFQENKQQKFTRKVNSDEEFLKKYADVYIQEFEKIYTGEFMQVEIYSLNHFIGMKFKLSKTPQTQFIYPKDKEEQKVFDFLANSLSIFQKTNTTNPVENLFTQKDIKGFEKDSFFIIKPNEYKCWHRAMAWYDVAEFKEAIQKAELKRLKGRTSND